MEFSKSEGNMNLILLIDDFIDLSFKMNKKFYIQKNIFMFSTNIKKDRYLSFQKYFQSNKKSKTFFLLKTAYYYFLKQTLPKSN